MPRARQLQHSAAYTSRLKRETRKPKHENSRPETFTTLSRIQPSTFVQVEELEHGAALAKNQLARFDKQVAGLQDELAQQHKGPSSPPPPPTALPSCPPASIAALPRWQMLGASAWRHARISMHACVPAHP